MINGVTPFIHVQAWFPIQYLSKVGEKKYPRRAGSW